MLVGMGVGGGGVAVLSLGEGGGLSVNPLRINKKPEYLPRT